MVVVVMGVAGVGKTRVGRALARRLGVAFHDADDLHPAANVAKMTRGDALTDDDRAPWLARLEALLRGLDREGRDAVLACSALRRAHREVLARAGTVRFVLLRADPETIRRRIARRTGHFMPASLLESQLATLEPPGPEALVVDATPPVAEVVEEIARRLAA